MTNRFIVDEAVIESGTWPADVVAAVPFRQTEEYVTGEHDYCSPVVFCMANWILQGRTG